MKTYNKCILMLMIIMTSACSTMDGYQPTIDQSPVGYSDPYGYNPNLYQQNAQNARLSQDMAECRQLAKRAVGGATSNVIQQGVVGGLLGAAGGAIGGAFAGNPAAGAAMGAAGGAFLGGAKGGIESDQQFKRAYQNCLAGRGHRVVN